MKLEEFQLIFISKRKVQPASLSAAASGICQRECRNNSLHYTRTALIIVICDSNINDKSRINITMYFANTIEFSSAALYMF